MRKKLLQPSSGFGEYHPVPAKDLDQNKSLAKRMGKKSKAAFLTRALSITIMLLSFLSVSTFAQTKTVTGVVTNDAGTPLENATVSVKGSNSIATQTTADGSFMLKSVPAGAKSVIISYVGHEALETHIGSGKITAHLKPVNASEEAVVVVGYGVQKKSSVTGSVATMGTKELDKVPPVASASNALIGNLPGLVATQSSGSPGKDGSTLSIRNFGTPLVIVDGVQPLFNTFDNIAPGEIESITVLKDASAAIYGSRAANGVILITTRRGKNGKPTIRLNSSYSLQSITSYPTTLSSGEYAQLTREITQNSGKPESAQRFSQAKVDSFYAGSSPNYPNTNWRKVLLNDNAPLQQHSLSISGGTDKVKYFGIIGYMDQKAFWKAGGDYNRYNVRSNVDAQITDNLSARIDFSTINGSRYFSARESNGNDVNLWGDYWTNQPVYPAFLPNTNLISYAGGAIGSAYASSNPAIAGYSQTETQFINVTGSLKYDFPGIKGLSAKILENYLQFYSDSIIFNKPYSTYTYNYGLNTYTPQTNGTSGGSTTGADKNETWARNRQLTTQLSLNYSTTIARNHKLDLLALYEAIDSSGYNLTAGRGNFFTPTIPYLVAGTTQSSSEVAAQAGRASYVGRLNYAYKNKYLLEATIRADASAAFPPAHRWGYFPAASLGWVVTQENFAKKIGWLNHLKLRASAGKSGLDYFGNYQYVGGYNTTLPGYAFGNPPAIVSTIAATLANPLLSWETSTIYNLGIDFSVLKSKVYGEFNLFKRNLNGIPGTPVNSAPSTFGANFSVQNINNEIDNGYEFQLGVRGHKGDFAFDIAGNVSYSSQKWGHFDEPNYSGNPKLAAINQKTGQYIDRSVGYLTDGVYTSQAEINAIPYTYPDKANLKVGDIKFVDRNGDGVLDQYDQTTIGRVGLPHTIYGLRLNFQYKNFNLITMFQGAGGNYVNTYYGSLLQSQQYFDGRWDSTSNAKFPQFPRSGTQTNENTPAYVNNTFYLKKAYYIRLKTLNFGYNLPKKLLAKAHIEAANVYIAGFNLLTIDALSKYGIDPEAPTTNQYYYPQQRTMSIGLNVTL